MILSKLRNYWQSQGIVPPSGCSSNTIKTFEQTNDVRLHSELLDYYIQINGMGKPDVYDTNFFSFWPLESVERLEHFTDFRKEIIAYKNFFVFADHSICLPCYAIQLSADGEGSHPVISMFTDTQLRISVVANSFNNFIERYLYDDSERDNLGCGI